jgi:hypothetical protein
VKAGLVTLLVAGLNAGAGLTADGGGRAGNEAGVWDELRPGGGGYDMMNVCSW